MRIAGAALLALAAAAGPAPLRAESGVLAARHPLTPHVAEAAQRFGIPDAWIWRVMHAESRGRPRAVSHAGAMGLMQIMPATWAMLTARHHLGPDPFDPRANILAGAAYLRAMWDRYGDVRLMLAAYNAGPGRADAYAAGRRALPAETIAYIAAIAPGIDASGVAPRAPALPAAEPGWRSASLFADSPRDEETGASTAMPEPDGRKAAAPVAPVRGAPASLFAPLSGQSR